MITGQRPKFGILVAKNQCIDRLREKLSLIRPECYNR